MTINWQSNFSNILQYFFKDFLNVSRFASHGLRGFHLLRDKNILLKTGKLIFKFSLLVTITYDVQVLLFEQHITVLRFNNYTHNPHSDYIMWDVHILYSKKTKRFLIKLAKVTVIKKKVAILLGFQFHSPPPHTIHVW